MFRNKARGGDAVPGPNPSLASPPADRSQRQQILREHFGTLAALFDPATCYRIEQLGIGADWRCWEVGAGGGTVARWLAGRVGGAGHVLATDVDTAALAASAGLDAEVLRHELGAEPAPRGEFDLVHARLVLEHITDYPAGLATMVAALRPGGWLLAESADPMLQSLACPDETGPAQALANKVRHAIWALDGHSTQKTFGRMLPRLLRDAGLSEVGAEVRFPLGGQDAARLQQTLITRRGDRLVASGLVSSDEITRHLADLAAGTLDLAAFPVVSAWGRKPG
jgi:2-polyprenyl-3-methyl-5-hydroxy-6-metoxy-1,4-benzoquinol methylase